MRPMQRLSDAIKDIAEGEGDLTRRLDIENNDEFGELSRYFNAFIDKIHTSIDQVKTTTVELERSVESLVEQTQSTLSMIAIKQNVQTVLPQPLMSCHPVQWKFPAARAMHPRLQPMPIHSRSKAKAR